MVSSLTFRLPPEKQNGLSGLFSHLSTHLESVSAEDMEQEIRHALRQVAADTGFATALAVFELEAGTPRRMKTLATDTADEAAIAEVSAAPWMIERVAAREPVLLTSDDAASPSAADALRDTGIQTVIVVPWQQHEKTAAAILGLRGGPGGSAISRDRVSFIEFVRQVGGLVLRHSGPGSFAAVDRPPRGHQPLGSVWHGAIPAVDTREDGIVGQSDAWRYVMFRVEQVANTQATVLLLGETGTGKELVARAIHRRSTRRNNRFVALNCSALPATLMESELFGRERGAFTGASVSQAGRFEIAHRGTIFLDEAGDLPLELQPKLLRVLQEGQLDRLGSTHTTSIDVRVIAATNRDLMSDVRNERFRRDLYYRLNVFPITLPALRERPADVPLLAAHFLERFSRQLRKPVEPISKPIMRVLREHHWPGNIRELENVIQRAIILSSGGVISMDDICLSSVIDSGGTAPGAGGETTLLAVEREHILRILASTSWRIEGPRGAARALGLKPSTLRSRLQKLSIQRAS